MSAEKEEQKERKKSKQGRNRRRRRRRSSSSFQVKRWFCGAEAPQNQKKKELQPFSRGAWSNCFHKYVAERSAEVVASQSSGIARTVTGPNESWIT